ncbi:MAG: hypothetical protein ACI4C1_09430, partial [Lachnospiraceae bacterium]
MHLKKISKKFITISGISIILILFIVWILIQYSSVHSPFQYFVKNLSSGSTDIAQSDFETQLTDRLNELLYYYAKYGDAGESPQNVYLNLAGQPFDYIVLKYMDLEQKKEDDVKEKLLVILYPQNQEYVPIIFNLSYVNGQLCDSMAAREGVQNERLDFQSVKSKDGEAVLQTYLDMEKEYFTVWYQGTLTLEQVTKPSYEHFTEKEEKLEKLEAWAEN